MKRIFGFLIALFMLMPIAAQAQYSAADLSVTFAESGLSPAAAGLYRIHVNAGTFSIDRNTSSARNFATFSSLIQTTNGVTMLADKLNVSNPSGDTALIYNSAASGDTRIFGGSSGTNGAGLVLYGGSHGSTPNQTWFYSGSVGYFAASNPSGATGLLANTVNTGDTRFFGGNSGTAGAGIILYGGAHGATPNQFLFNQGSSTILTIANGGAATFSSTATASQFVVGSSTVESNLGTGIQRVGDDTIFWYGSGSTGAFALKSTATAGAGDRLLITSAGAATFYSTLQATVITASTAFRAPDGAVAYGFTGATNTGMWRSSGDATLNFSAAGNHVLHMDISAVNMGSGTILAWTDNASAGAGTLDLKLARISAHVLGVKDNANANEVRVFGDATKYAAIGHDGTDFYLVNNSDSRLRFYNNGGFRWNISASSTGYALYPEADNVSSVGQPSKRVAEAHVASFIAVGTNPAGTGAIRLGNNSGLLIRDAGNANNIDAIGVTNSDEIVVNNAQGDYNFIARSEANASAFVVDAGAFSGVGSVGIGGAPTTDTTFLLAHPALTATANVNYFSLLASPAGAVTIPTGTASVVATAAFIEPNITATGTATLAATVYIGNAPTEGATNAALYVASGATILKGTFAITGSTGEANLGTGLQLIGDDTVMWYGSGSTGTFNLKSTSTGSPGDRLAITSAGAVRMHAYGAGIAKFDASGNITSDATITSGTYTPTLTNVSNVAATSANQCQYSRVGSTVTVSCVMEIDPASTATQTELTISLPVASNIGAEEDLAGTAVGGFTGSTLQNSARIFGEASANVATMLFYTIDTSPRNWSVVFVYQVI